MRIPLFADSPLEGWPSMDRCSRVFQSVVQPCSILASRDAFWWQYAPSPVKLRYLQKYAVGRTALDIGTGRGFYAQMLQRLGYQVIGVDLRPQAGVVFPLSQARLSAVPFAHPFDTVVAFDVLEHEPNEAAALGELRRLTRQRLLLSVPNADDSLLLPYNLTYKHHVDKTHQREYTAEELQAKLEQAGFQIFLLQAEGPVNPAIVAEFVRPRWLRPVMRLGVRTLHRLKVLDNPALRADLYVVAEPR